MFNKKPKEDFNKILSELSIPAYGYELIRETFLKDLLGKDYNSILYWGGKNLARKIPLHSIEAILAFFEEAGWGTLARTKHEKDEMIFTLESDYITNRFKREGEPSFQLEAGFLAEQIQNLIEEQAEAMEQQNKKLNQVMFKVRWG